MYCCNCESNNIDLMKEYETFERYWVEEYWCKDCGFTFQDVQTEE